MTAQYRFSHSRLSTLLGSASNRFSVHAVLHAVRCFALVTLNTPNHTTLNLVYTIWQQQPQNLRQPAMQGMQFSCTVKVSEQVLNGTKPYAGGVYPSWLQEVPSILNSIHIP